MSPVSTLESLALACYACELAGFDVTDIASDVADAADRGDAFELVFDVSDEQRFRMLFDPESQQFEIAVHKLGAYSEPALVFAALQLNHELPRGNRRFSMEMFTGDVVLSDEVEVATTSADALALVVCDLLIGMDELMAFASEDPAEDTLQVDPAFASSLRV